MRAAALVVLLVFLSSAACVGEGNGSSPTILQDPSRPYVVTAVDNHFHDAHPSEPLALDRSLVFKNEGRNLHNVTIAGTTLSRDLEPDTSFTISSLGSLVDGPGRYRLFCKYHADLGMTGDLVVVG
ncbi:MAG TPA: hypothetical protein VGS09_08530 [Actinomycetota bacterium]|jgi:hypothetical protein|nr:hypothetical protein [Actinomycetota bacterium]